MGKYKTIVEDIETVTNKEVVKKTKISMIAIVLMVIAIICFIGGASIDDPNSSLSTFLFSAGVCLFLFGIIKVFVNRSCYCFRPTNSQLKEITLYFDAKESMPLQTCMEMKRFEELQRMKKQVNTGVKVEAMIAGDHKFAAVQILEYVPYSYETVTPVICYYGDEAKTFINFFK